MPSATTDRPGIVAQTPTDIGFNADFFNTPGKVGHRWSIVAMLQPHRTMDFPGIRSSPSFTPFGKMSSTTI